MFVKINSRLPNFRLSFFFYLLISLFYIYAFKYYAEKMVIRSSERGL